MGDGGHSLVRMEWRPARWSVCLPLLIFPCTVKSRSSLLSLAHPGAPRKGAVKRLCVCVISQKYKSQSCNELHQYIALAKSFMTTYYNNISDKQLLKYRQKRGLSLRPLIVWTVLYATSESEMYGSSLYCK